jgi:hypothetical protein
MRRAARFKKISYTPDDDGDDEDRQCAWRWPVRNLGTRKPGDRDGPNR